MESKPNRAVFIDRDGTLNDMVYDETHGLLDSPRRAGQVALCKGASEFLKGVKELGFLRLIVTNQPGLAKGTLTLSDLNAVNRRILSLLKSDDAGWEEFLYCPHHPKWTRGGNRVYVQVCTCRKPEPGLLLEAARRFHIDLKRSWMVGDGLNDIEAGKKAGCRTILVTRLKLEQIERFLKGESYEPDFVAVDLREALAFLRKTECGKE